MRGWGLVFCGLSLVALCACPAGAPENGPPCSDEKPCPNGEVCVEFVCYEVCSDSLDCGAAQACVDGFCQDYARACEQHGDCVDGWYCFNDACIKKLGLGNPCGTVGAACASSHCVEGVCCDTSCTGVCRSCVSGVGIGDGDDGLCVDVLVGEDPNDVHCPGPVACNGGGGCFSIAQGMSCTFDYECLTGRCEDGVCCNGVCDGVCETCTTGTCEVVPDGSDADDECTGVAACNGARACWAGILGDLCDASHQCVSGFCVDGVCCDGGCDGVCEGCDGSNAGTCTPVSNATDPGTCSTTEIAGECATAPCTCDAGGACKLSGAQLCSTGATCANGPCLGGVCCDSACSGACMSCNSDDTGQAPGACAAIEGGADPYDQCNGTLATACDGAGACHATINGHGCDYDYQCASGFCVDDVCCESTCTGECQACDGVLTASGTPGDCSYVVNWQDPAQECPAETACNGAGICWAKAGGSGCNDDSECISGDCCGGQCSFGWQEMTSNTEEALFGVWGVSESDVVAVGRNGTILRYNGISWNPDAGSPTSSDLLAVSGSASNNIIAVGAAGTIARFNGTNWALVTPAPTAEDLEGVWVASSSLAYAVGTGGIILRWNGSTWTGDASGTVTDLHAIWGSGAVVYAAGGSRGTFSCTNGLVLRRDGTWSEMSGFDGVCAYSVVADAGDLFVGTHDGNVSSCAGGTVHRYRAGDWSDMLVEQSTLGLAVATSRVVSVGCRLRILKDGAWTSFTPPGWHHDAWGADDCSLFAVGDSGRIYRYN